MKVFSAGELVDVNASLIASGFERPDTGLARSEMSRN
jgi:hypothetical protein